MNKTKIEFCDYTWNPITGCYGPGGTKTRPNRCSFCYAKRIATRFGKGEDPFAPAFHEDRLQQPFAEKTPSTIFVCSMSDLFGHGVNRHWISRVLNTINGTPRHTYLLLTKSPHRIPSAKIPPNVVIGVSGGSPGEVLGRVDGLRIATRGSGATTLWGSIEPLRDEWDEDAGYCCQEGEWEVALDGLDWITIGCQTGPGARPAKIETVRAVVEAAKKKRIAVFLKDNAPWTGDRPREMPR